MKQRFGQLLMKYLYVKIEYGSDKSRSISATIEGICKARAHECPSGSRVPILITARQRGGRGGVPAVHCHIRRKILCPHHTLLVFPSRRELYVHGYIKYRQTCMF